MACAVILFAPLTLIEHWAATDPTFLITVVVKRYMPEY